MPLFTPPPAHAQDITTGLVAHWKLDETSGTTATDSSGNGNDGTLDSGDFSTYSASGLIGSSFYNPTFRNITTADSASLSPTTAITVSAWFKTLTTNKQRIVSKWGPPSTDDSYMLWVNGIGAFNNGQANFELTTTTSNKQLEGGPVISGDQKWHHMVGTYDGATMKLYLDGVMVQSTSHSGTIQDGTTGVLIGYGGGGVFTGNIDDVRIYNRALTAADINELYQSVPGTMRYNTAEDVVEYNNGEQWIAAGPNHYKPDAVEFDGSSYLTHNAALGPASSTKWTGSVWVRKNVGSQVKQCFIDTENTNDLTFDISTANDINVAARNAAATAVLDISTTETITDTNWHHVIFSIDLTDTGKRYIYIDDVPATLNIATYNTAETMYFANPAVAIGKSFDGGGWDLNGDVADFWMDFNTYIDLSVEANRRKFIDASGKPVNLGADGSGPTGSQPDIFLSGDTAAWHTNKGTGGGFTENGALTDATFYSGAVNTALPQGCPSIGDTCDDGTIYAGLSPDGNVEMYTTPSDLGSYAWNNANSANYVTTSLTNVNTGAANTKTLVGTDSDSGTSGFQTHQAAQACYDLVADGTDDWYLPSENEILLVLNNIRPLYPNGFLSNSNWTSKEQGSNTARLMYSDATGFTGTGTNAKEQIRSVRCVRKGPAPRCANPYGVEGSITYNTTSDQMQFCDGQDWIAMGPPGDGGAGCSNPAGSAGDMTYNTTFNVMQYCEGDTWVTVLGKNLSGPWTPLNLSTAPVLWFDADNAASVTETAGSVSAWTDKINGRVASLDSGSGNPTYSTTEFESTLPGITFTGNERMLGTLTSAAAGDTFGFIVVDHGGTTDGSGYAQVVSINAGAEAWNNQQSFWLGSQGATTACVFSISSCTNLGSFSTTGDLLYGGVRSATDERAGAFNGALALTTESRLIDLDATSDDFYIGGDAGSDSYDFVGTIGEIIILNYEPSLTERQKIEGYLAHKWGLESKLPAGHPYKASPP